MRNLNSLNSAPEEKQTIRRSNLKSQNYSSAEAFICPLARSRVQTHSSALPHRQPIAESRHVVNREIITFLARGAASLPEGGERIFASFRLGSGGKYSRDISRRRFEDAKTWRKKTGINNCEEASRTAGVIMGFLPCPVFHSRGPGRWRGGWSGPAEGEKI